MDLGESVSTDKEKFKKYTVKFFFYIKVQISMYSEIPFWFRKGLNS